MVAVTYGRSPASASEFECRHATIVEDSTRIECVSAAGVGAPLYWRVGVGIKPHSSDWTLYSAALKVNSSGYQPPSVGNVSAPQCFMLALPSSRSTNWSQDMRPNSADEC